MQLLQQSIFSASGLGNLPRIVWMTFDQELPEPVKTMQAELDELGKGTLFHIEHLTDAGAFLLDLYQECTGSLPRTRQPYQCLDSRLRIERTDYDEHGPGQLIKDAIVLDARLYVFYRRDTERLDKYSAPSNALSRFAELMTKDLLLFDSLERFGTPETVHHGLPSLSAPEDKRYRTTILRSSDKTCIWHEICATASPGTDSIIGEVCHGYRNDAWRVF